MTLTTADVAPKDRVVIKASRQQATVTKTTETTVTVRYREAIPGRAMMAFGRYQMVSLELPYSEIELVDELKSAHSLKGIETLARYAPPNHPRVFKIPSQSAGSPETRIAAFGRGL